MTNLDSWNAKSRDSMGVPEAYTRSQEDGFVSGKLLYDLVKISFAKVRGSHLIEGMGG